MYGGVLGPLKELKKMNFRERKLKISILKIYENKVVNIRLLKLKKLQLASVIQYFFFCKLKHFQVFLLKFFTFLFL